MLTDMARDAPISSSHLHWEGDYRCKLNCARKGELAELFEIRLARRRREVQGAIDIEIARLGLMKQELETIDAEVILAAIDCFASPKEAARWLTNPEAGFTNGTPIEIAATVGGKESVMSLLLGLIDGAVPPTRPIDSPCYFHGLNPAGGSSDAKIC